MNQMSQIIVPLENLFAPGIAPDPNNADPMMIALQVARRYPFLPQPVFIEVEGDRIILNYPAAFEDAKKEAERLAQRAARHAGNGDCHRAIAIWEQVLQLVPDDLVARRDIGEACSELGDFIKAKHYLSEALLVDFEDIGSLVALANLAVRQEDYGAAEVYALKAVAAGPQNARALNCLGAVQFHTGRVHGELPFKQRLAVQTIRGSGFASGNSQGCRVEGLGRPLSPRACRRIALGVHAPRCRTF